MFGFSQLKFNICVRCYMAFIEPMHCNIPSITYLLTIRDGFFVYSLLWWIGKSLYILTWDGIAVRFSFEWITDTLFHFFISCGIISKNGSLYVVVCYWWTHVMDAVICYWRLIPVGRIISPHASANLDLWPHELISIIRLLKIMIPALLGQI